MAKELHYTGSWPPVEVLSQYPNWAFALDAECEDGLDETTIRPESQQAFISDDTDFTRGDGMLADGTRCEAIFSICDDFLDAVYVRSDGGWWGVRQRVDRSWEVIEGTWLPEADRNPSVSLADARLFPVKVVSFLERSDGTKFEVTIPLQAGLPTTAKKPWFRFW